MPMRPRHLLFVVLLLVITTGNAQPADSEPGHERLQLSSRQCGLSTPFNVLADNGGIWLYRQRGTPREIFFHAGKLSIDHSLQQITVEDARRLSAMEQQIRELMPQVTAIAHSMVNLTFEALGASAQAISGADQAPRKLRRQHTAALKYVDSTLGKGRWEQQVFDQKFEARIQDAVASYARSLVGNALWQVVSGRSEHMEARLEQLEDQLDQRMAAHTTVLTAKAQALCSQVAALRQLQDGLQLRYQDQPLQMLVSVQDDDPGSALDVTTGISDAVPAHGDRPRHNALDADLQGSQQN